MLTGLAVGVGFKAGLFNIGGTRPGPGRRLRRRPRRARPWPSSPPPIAFPIAILAGALGGALYGFIPGALKAFTGAHEVVSTIMLNSLAVVRDRRPRQRHLQDHRPDVRPTADVGNAAMPILFGRNGNLGIFITLVLVALT